MPKRVLLCGAPSSGKTTIVNALIQKEYYCKPEISRELIKESQKNGIEQPFLKDPEAFDTLLLTKRIQQFENLPIKPKANLVFYDRGIIDNVAYMNYGLKRVPLIFDQAIRKYTYDYIFLFEPWKDIHSLDSERYETFDIAKEINNSFKEVLKNYQLDYTSIPFESITHRTSFILDNISS